MFEIISKNYVNTWGMKYRQTSICAGKMNCELVNNPKGDSGKGKLTTILSSNYILGKLPQRLLWRCGVVVITIN